MEARPRIELTPTPLDDILELASKIVLAAMWVLTLYTFVKLPATIPIHFTATGQADDYGNKLTLFILPFFGTLLYFGLTQLNKYPHIFNYATRITPDNARRQYTIATRLFRVLKLAILLIFSLIILFTYLTTTGATHGLGFWFLPTVEALLIVPLAIAIVKSLRKNKVA